MSGVLKRLWLETVIEDESPHPTWWDFCVLINLLTIITMKTKFKNILGWVIVVAALVGLGYWFFSSIHASRSNTTTDNKSVQPIEDPVAKELADKHQAVTGWDSDPFAYTDVFQQKLLGKPVLFTATLEDVYQQNGNLYAKFLSGDSSLTDYVLIVECDDKTAEMLLQHPFDTTDSLMSFDMVVTVQSVSKPIFELASIPTNDEDVSADVTEATDTLLIRGVAVDIEPAQSISKK
jgi:hypothetical protein